MPYAIDFGTTNSIIARWNPATQQADLLNVAGLSQGKGANASLIPSLVQVEDASQQKIWAGQTVLDRGWNSSNNQRFFRNFKRGIGVEIPGFLPELDGQIVTFDQVGAWFLTELLQTLQATEGNSLDRLILTVPVDSFETYRRWLSLHCQAWSAEQIQLLDEPTAVALGYDRAEAGVVLVMDFGGGTVDFALVQLPDLSSASKSQGFLLKWGDRLMGKPTEKKTLARVLGKAGLILGGSDIDQWLAADLTQAQGLTPTALTHRLAERLKIQLSQSDHGSEVYFDDRSLESYDFSYSRAQLNTLLGQHQFFERLETALDHVLRQGESQGIEKTQIEAVLVVGGTSQIPAVQDWIHRFFDPTKIFADRPFEAIALGALKLLQGQGVQDILYHGYGVRYWNRRQNCHGWHPIIPGGQAYPMAEPVEITLGASLDNQPNIELIIGELGSTLGATEVYLDGDRLMTRTLTSDKFIVHPLNDRAGARSIAKLDPLGAPGNDRIRVQFWVDSERFLRVTVIDLLLDKILMKNQRVVQLS